MKDVALRPLADGNAFTICNSSGRGRYVIVCDHASKNVPHDLHGLGITEAELSRHIGWDIGAERIARLLATRFDSPAVICGTSRLVIDCNRRLTCVTLAPEVSDGTEIPGNKGLSWRDLGRRIERFYIPYHSAVTQTIESALGRGIRPIILSVHSFTPVMNGQARPWAIGISHTPDRTLSVPMIERLRRGANFEVGDDQPYDADPEIDYTIFAHAYDRQLPHIQVEFRQDLVAEDRAADHWGSIFAEAVADTVRHHAAA
jgi:predicted N-formylglutamate amidohydrolase